MPPPRTRYHCPVELAVDAIGPRWRPVILAHLKEGVHRYGQLRRRMPGVSDKVLTQRLRELEADGLVERTVNAEPVPPQVTYRLSAVGETLAPVLRALHDWGAQHARRTGATIEPADADLAPDDA